MRKLPRGVVDIYTEKYAVGNRECCDKTILVPQYDTLDHGNFPVTFALFMGRTCEKQTLYLRRFNQNISLELKSAHPEDCTSGHAQALAAVR